MRKKNRI
jgi:hypothetical protein